MLEIKVTSDTGYDTDVRGEPDAADFEDAASSSSLLELYAWQCTADVDTNWNEIWRRHEWPDEDWIPIDHVGAHFRVIGCSYDFAQLFDEQAVEAAVASLKIELANKFGITA